MYTSKQFTKLNKFKQLRYASSSSNSASDQLMRLGKFPGRGNYLANFLPAGSKYVIERFGKFNRVEQPGLCILVPIVDKISYVVDERELCIRIDPELATTSDNVKVSLGGNLYVQFYDAEKACYGASTPIYAVSQFAQSVMRTSVGGLILDTLFKERAILNVKIKEALFEGTEKWGCRVIRFEITSLDPVDKHVAESLHKQSTAERDRREKIITAEADRKQTELNADAYKYKQIAEAQGDAEKKKISADADAYAILKKAEAEKEGINLIASAMNSVGGSGSMNAKLAQQYISALEKMGGRSTVIIPQNLSDIASMISVGSTVFKDLTNKGTETKKE